MIVNAKEMEQKRKGSELKSFKYHSLTHYGMSNFFDTYRKGKKYAAKCRLRKSRRLS